MRNYLKMVAHRLFGPVRTPVQWRAWAIEQAVASGADDPAYAAQFILAYVFPEEVGDKLDA